MTAAEDGEAGALGRIDTFPYRHRVGAVMTAPAVTTTADVTLAAATAEMRGRGVSSLLVVDDSGRPHGIFTERDVLTAIMAHGAEGLARPIGAHLSSPVHAVAADAFVYTAIARMDRLGIRHLAVTDGPGGRLVGVVSARALLRQRAGAALILGDEIAEARDGAALAAIHATLPALAEALRTEKLTALDVAQVISAVLRDLSARAAVLAEAAMAREGRGAAPARWCYLVLGSGGRGESLLSADQDNALIHAGTAADDAWYAELGRRAADLLNEAGIPYCRGKVMASESQWRGNLDDWTKRIAGWVDRPSAENMLNVDIFYDFRAVHGDYALAQELRRRAVVAAQSSPMFLALLAEQLTHRGVPLGLFGRILTEHGRADLKSGGTMPVVAGARVLALCSGTLGVATSERLAAAVADRKLNENDAGVLQEAFEILMELILEQQILDVDAGLAPSTRIEVKRLPAWRRRHLKSALVAAQMVDEAVHNALSAGG